MRISLRIRLIAATASATALILAVCGVVIYSVVSSSLLSAFDATLLAKARALATMAERKGHEVSLEYDPAQMPEFQKKEDPEFFQCWYADGRVIARSPSLGAADLQRLAPSVNSPARGKIRLPRDKRGRAVAIAFLPRPEDEEEATTRPAATPVVLLVARRTEDLEETLEGIGWLLAGVCGSAIIISAAAMAWLIGRGLRRVDQLAARIAGVGDANLSDRIRMDYAPTELAPVVNRLNELLQRLAAAFAREKSFTSDVAHELRTPLAGLQTAMEVGTSRPRSVEEYQQLLTRCLGTTRQMHGMVDNLLTLARAESSQLAINREPLAIKPLLEECWTGFAGRAAQRGLQVTWRVAADGILQADREKLRLVLRNLFDNAVCYADANGSIGIIAEPSAGQFAVEVANTGSQLSQEEAAHVFDRFWRGDAARAQTGIHCGLGLTLVKRLVESMAGTAAVTSAVGGPFRITLTFPRPANDAPGF